MDPAEFKAFRTMYHQLHTGISSSLEDLVAPAYSERLVGDRVNRAASCPLNDRDYRTTEFLNAIQKRVRVDPSAFDLFLKILSQDRAHEYLAVRLRDERTKEQKNAMLRRKESEVATFREVPTTTMRKSPVTERPLNIHLPCPFRLAEPGAISDPVNVTVASKLARRQKAVPLRGTHTPRRPLTPPPALHGYDSPAWIPQSATGPAAGPAHARASPDMRPERKSEPTPLPGSSTSYSDLQQTKTLTATQDAKHPSITYTASTPTASTHAATSGSDVNNQTKTATDSEDYPSELRDEQYLYVRTRQHSMDSLSSQSSEEEFVCALPSLGNSSQVKQPIQETVTLGESAMTAASMGTFGTSVDIKKSKELEALLEEAHRELDRMKQREEIFMKQQEGLQAKIRRVKERKKDFHAALLSTQASLSEANQRTITLETQLQTLYQQLELYKVKSYAFDVVRKNDALERQVQRLNDMLTNLQIGYTDEYDDFPQQF